MKAMVEAGMDVARLNLSHGTIDDTLERLRRLRKVAKDCGKELGILADLPGPKVRIGQLPGRTEIVEDSIIMLEPGTGPSKAGHFTVGYESLLSDIHVGDRLAIGDGGIVLIVEEHLGDKLKSRVLFGGATQARPGLHIPSSRLKINTPTDQDLIYCDAMVENDIDMIALSFVRSAHDVRRIGTEPAPRGPLIISKIETKAAVENLEGLIMASGAVMVARGDLGTECSLEDLPHLQKDIIERCIALGRPAITATQMLESMIDSPMPTRAEASDVANAVFDGTSAVMLSGETAVGRDPAHVVATMAKIAHRADQEFDYGSWAHQIRRDRLSEPQSVNAQVTDVMTMATWRAAAEMGVSSIICISRSGFTVRAIARFRPEAKILGFSPEPRTLRQLTLSWGAEPILVDRISDNLSTVNNVLEIAKTQGHIRSGEVVAVLGGSTATIGSTDTLQMVRCP